MKIKYINLFSAVFTGVVGFWNLYLSCLLGQTDRGAVLALGGAVCLAFAAVNGVLAFSGE